MSSDGSDQRGWGECDLETCDIKWSIFQYQPNLAANAFFIAIFGISMIIHIYQEAVDVRYTGFSWLCC
jgi:hypothetical protein